MAFWHCILDFSSPFKNIKHNINSETETGTWLFSSQSLLEIYCWLKNRNGKSQSELKKKKKNFNNFNLDD